VTAFALYLAAAVAYGYAFASRQALAGRVATATLTAAALVHTFQVGMVTMEIGMPPLAGRGGAISGFVLVLAITYLYLELSTEERAIGTLVTPMLAALQLLAALEGQPADLPGFFQGRFLALHVGALLSAYASFALAFVIGITYVLLFRELKTRTPGVFFSRLPPLQVLDRMNMRAITVGWFLLTVGLIAGVFWLMDARAAMPHDPRFEAMTLLDPKIVVALVCWVLYSGTIAARRWAGLSARRAAWLSALGFALVLLNFLPVAYFFSDSHNFA
jgi:ABC-type transport system involved in cytochrome c biogenesis permease subunit